MRNTLLLVFLSFTALLNAQTCFYKLSAVVENGNRSAGNCSGIFVTFIDKGCYDSDIEGCTMNNGFLDLHIKGENRISYKGTSYWGAAEYVFSADYELLNVIAGDCVYIYKKSSNPTQRVSTYYGAKAEDNVAPGLMPASAFAVESATVPEDEYRGKLSPESYRESYLTWERQVKSHYECLVKIVETDSGDEYHIKKYRMGESVMYKSDVTKLMIKAQHEMRMLRQEAASYGVTIMQSSWENCTVP